MILFLDDDNLRTRKFVMEVPSAKTTETAAGMIELLSEFGGGIDCVFLDHDLGGKVYVDSSLPDTGMEVVRWIENNKPSVGRFVVHSHHTQAGFEMVDRLKKAGYTATYVPFINMVLDNSIRQMAGLN